MAKDWRDVLKGVKLADLERHPTKYRREPYRTAMLEMAEEGRRQMEEVNKVARREMEEIAKSVRQYRSIIAQVEPELHAAFDIFAELQPAKAVAHIQAMRSARASATAKRSRKRRSPYAAEFQQWIREAAKRLALSPHADDKELAKAIRKETRTNAAARYLAEWIPHNRIAIEELAIKLRAKVATRGDVGNGTRNTRRNVGV